MVWSPMTLNFLIKWFFVGQAISLEGVVNLLLRRQHSVLSARCTLTCVRPSTVMPVLSASLISVLEPWLWVAFVCK